MQGDVPVLVYGTAASSLTAFICGSFMGVSVID